MNDNFDAVYSAEMMDDQKLEALREFDNLRATYEAKGLSKKESWLCAKAIVEGDEATAKDVCRRAFDRMREKEIVQTLRQQAKERQAAERDWFLKGFDG